jgi:hypothetical protein
MTIIIFIQADLLCGELRQQKKYDPGFCRAKFLRFFLLKNQAEAIVNYASALIIRRRRTDGSFRLARRVRINEIK